MNRITMTFLLLVAMAVGATNANAQVAPRVPVLRKIFRLPVNIDKNSQTWDNRYNSPHYQPANYGTGGAAYNSPEAQPYYQKRYQYWAGYHWEQTATGWIPYTQVAVVNDPIRDARSGKIEARTERYRKVTDRKDRAAIIDAIGKQGPAMKACAKQMDRYGTMSLECAELLGFGKDTTAVYTPNMMNPLPKKPGQVRRQNDKIEDVFIRSENVDFDNSSVSTDSLVLVDSVETVILSSLVKNRMKILKNMKHQIDTESFYQTRADSASYIRSYRNACRAMLPAIGKPFPNRATLEYVHNEWKKLALMTGTSYDNQTARSLGRRLNQWIGNSDPYAFEIEEDEGLIDFDDVPEENTVKPEPTAAKKVSPTPSNTYTPTIQLKKKYLRRAEKKEKKKN